MRYARWLILVLIVAQAHFLVAQLFDVKPVTDDVYAAIAKPSFGTNWSLLTKWLLQMPSQSPRQRERSSPKSSA
jgi:hypothetical protein